MIPSALGRYAIPIGVLLAIGTAYTYHRVEIRSSYKEGYSSATAEMAAKVANANKETAALERLRRDQSEAAGAAWSVERERLQGEVVDLLARGVDVRVCKPATAGGSKLSGDSKAAGSAPAAPQAEVDTLRSGRNVGPELVRLGAECEQYRAQLDALIRWIISTR